MTDNRLINANHFAHRNQGIDLLRALTMFVMIFVNDLWKIHDVPHWLEHAKFGEDFMGLADVVFPLFIFVVGMSIPYALERRYSKGMSVESTIGHIFSRTWALLIMGVFIVNSESRLSPESPYPIGVYWLLMVAAFILIWNYYPKNKDSTILIRIFKFVGYGILLFLAITYRDPQGGAFSAKWWGILGSIGWVYLLCSMIYIFTRSNLKYLVPIWLVFVTICILGSTLKEAWGGKPILLLPRPNFYHELLSILHIGNGSLAAFTMGGVIFSIITAKYNHLSAKRKLTFATIIGFVFFLLGVVARKFWMLSKLAATPTWIFYVIAIAIISYTLLTIMANAGKSNWLDIIKPAGTATLTCYLVPYAWYAVSDITGMVLPNWLTHGYMGLLNSLVFSLIIIGITWLLGKASIKLKI